MWLWTVVCDMILFEALHGIYRLGFETTRILILVNHVHVAADAEKNYHYFAFAVLLKWLCCIFPVVKPRCNKYGFSVSRHSEVA